MKAMTIPWISSNRWVDRNYDYCKRWKLTSVGKSEGWSNASCIVRQGNPSLKLWQVVKDVSGRSGSNSTTPLMIPSLGETIEVLTDLPTLLASFKVLKTARWSVCFFWSLSTLPVASSALLWIFSINQHQHAYLLIRSQWNGWEIMPTCRCIASTGRWPDVRFQQEIEEEEDGSDDSGQGGAVLRWWDWRNVNLGRVELRD
jgi:hypothetical protein